MDSRTQSSQPLETLRGWAVLPDALSACGGYESAPVWGEGSTSTTKYCLRYMTSALQLSSPPSVFEKFAISRSPGISSIAAADGELLTEELSCLLRLKGKVIDPEVVLEHITTVLEGGYGDDDSSAEMFEIHINRCTQ
jgi:hypothetical protein